VLPTGPVVSADLAFILGGNLDVVTGQRFPQYRIAATATLGKSPLQQPPICPELGTTLGLDCQSRAIEAAND
jgi:hypothetical protein